MSEIIAFLIFLSFIFVLMFHLVQNAGRLVYMEIRLVDTVSCHFLYVAGHSNEI